MNKVIGVLAIIFILCGCEKNIDFNLQNAAPVLVVDASIENNQAPQVVLTKSFNFFSSITPALLDSSFVHNAIVTINNGILTHQLKEYKTSLSGGYNYYYYSIDSNNLATAFTGAFNTSYQLHINVDGQNYDASTTIPLLTKKPDSIWWKPAPFPPNPADVVLMIKTTDPAGIKNYIRYFTKKNSGPFLPGENSVFDDQLVDGTTYQLQIEPGVDRNEKIVADSNYFKHGDTVTFKLCNIDYTTFTFWNTWEFAQQSIGNPFSQPNKVLGNISNGALGAFCGYAAFYKTLIIPK